MPDSTPRVSRRGLLRTAGIVMPALLAAPAVFASNRFAATPKFGAPICQAAATAPVTVVTGAPRRLRLT